MKLGGTWSFWAKAVAVLAALALLYYLYQRLTGGWDAAKAALGEAWDRVKTAAEPYTPEEQAVLAEGTIYHPELDTRSFWDKLRGVPIPYAAAPSLYPEYTVIQ